MERKDLKFSKMTCAAIVSLSAALVFPGPAHSIVIFGKCFGNSCDAEAINPNIVDPRTYNLDLRLTHNSDERLEDAVKSASELWRGQDGAVGGSIGLVSRAKADYQRILAALYNEGYYSGAISITINGMQASDIKPGTDIGNVSNVVVAVEAGDVYRFGHFSVDNRAPEALDDDLVEPPRNLKVNRGDIARAGQVAIARNIAVEEWRQQGFPKARIETQNVKAIHPEKLLNVRLRVSPGPRASYGEVQVNGTNKVDLDFVAYMTGIDRGREFDPDDIKRAKKRLDELDVFSVRKIQEDPDINEQGELPLTVTVKEKDPRRFGLGATASSTDGGGVEAFWLHRNLFGRAEQLRLQADVGGFGTTFDAEELDYKLSAGFTKPGVITPDTDWVSTVFAKREFNDTFDGETAGGSTGLTHAYSNEISLAGSGFAEYSQFDDAFGVRDFITAGLLGSVTFDHRDHVLEPTKGYFAWFEAMAFHEFEFDNTGVRLNADLRAYTALDEDADSVLAGRLHLGTLLGVDRTETPANFLYFAGGGGSVRGFGYKNIGVIETNGDITGGRSVIEASLEWRQRVNEDFGVVAFADAGIVGAEPFVDFSEEIRVSAGLGLRYYTGLGPIRIDVAVPLNPQGSDPDFGIFAGIGQAF